MQDLTRQRVCHVTPTPGPNIHANSCTEDIYLDEHWKHCDTVHSLDLPKTGVVTHKRTTAHTTPDRSIKEFQHCVDSKLISLTQDRLDKRSASTDAAMELRVYEKDAKERSVRANDSDRLYAE